MQVKPTKVAGPIICGLAALGLMGLSPTHADVTVTGFSNFTLNTNTADTSASMTTSGLTLTGANVDQEAASAFYNVAVPVSNGFTASFVYTDNANGSTPGDGVFFVLQNGSPTDLGGSGSSYGYAGGTMSTDSFAYGLSLYQGSATDGGYNYYSQATVPGGFVSVSPVDLSSGDPILVTLSYVPDDATSSGTETMTLTDEDNPTDTITTTHGRYLPAVDVGPTTYIGFTGSTGGYTATQTITDFTFSAASAAPEPSQVGMLALISLGLGGLLLMAHKRKLEH